MTTSYLPNGNILRGTFERSCKELLTEGVHFNLTAFQGVGGHAARFRRRNGLGWHDCAPIGSIPCQRAGLAIHGPASICAQSDES